MASETNLSYSVTGYNSTDSFNSFLITANKQIQKYEHKVRINVFILLIVLIYCYILLYNGDFLLYTRNVGKAFLLFL